MIEFDMPKEQSSIIKVIGVGGGGTNAVNHMYKEGIEGVNFVIANTDKQALEMSPVPNKIQIGPEITEGLGAGSDPEVGEQSAIESLEEIKEILSKGTKMCFVTAGMGGGTGTGAAPVIAKTAKELGILTIGIVTTPFSFEGRRKINQANEGIERLKESVDSILIISNDKLREIFGNLTRSAAFQQADNILATAAKSISEIITFPGEMNVDFADVEYVMQNSGVAIMGSALSSGEGRAIKAVEEALSSPLLNDNDVRGAQHILLNVTTGTEEMLVDEINEITDYVRSITQTDTDLILGLCDDESLGENISVTVIATGFEGGEQVVAAKAPEKKVIGKIDSSPTPVATPTPPAPEPEAPKVEEEETPKTFEFNVSREDTTSSIPPPPVPEPEESKSEPDGMSLKKTDEPAPEQSEMRISRSVQPTADSSDEDDEGLPQRVQRLREMSMNLNYRNRSSMKEMENRPAYERRNVDLEDTPNSGDNNVSNYSLTDGEENGGRPQINNNNSYLHDNVD